MTNIKIDLRDVGGEPTGKHANRRDSVTVWAPAFRPASAGDFTVAPSPRKYYFDESGVVTLQGIEAGPLVVQFDVRQLSGKDTFEVDVPEGAATVQLRELIAGQYDYSPPVISDAQRLLASARNLKEELDSTAAEVKANKAASQRDAGTAKDGATRSESAAEAARQSEVSAATSASEAEASESSASASASKAAESEKKAAASASSAKSDADRVSKIAESTSWSGDKLTVNGKTSPPLTGPKGADGKDGATTWTGISDKPTVFPPQDHKHTVADVTDLPPIIASKADLVGGKVPTSQIPEVALTKPQSVTSRGELLALAAQEGDVGIITAGPDKGTYMLGAGEPSQWSSWVPLASSADAPVQSVNGQVGTVVLSAADVGAPTTSELTTGLAGKANKSHTHTVGDVTGLDDALADKADAVHTHTTSQVEGLDDALAGKADKSHTHTVSQVEGLEDTLAGKANTSHTHTKADITDLETITSSVSDSTIVKREYSGGINVPITPTLSAHAASKRYVDTEVGKKADASHTHTTSQILGLGTALNGKSNTGHKHTTSDLTDYPGHTTVMGQFSYGKIPVRESDSDNIRVSSSPEQTYHVVTKKYVDARPALFSGSGAPPSSIAGATVGDWWLDTSTMELHKITGV